jgi:hypothetical protein
MIFLILCRFYLLKVTFKSVICTYSLSQIHITESVHKIAMNNKQYGFIFCFYYDLSLINGYKIMTKI